MSWKHIEDRNVRGRKEHRCILCGLRIRKGALHIKRTGISEGGFVTARMHAVCESLTRDWDEHEWEIGYSPEEFRCYSLGITNNGHPCPY